MPSYRPNLTMILEGLLLLSLSTSLAFPLKQRLSLAQWGSYNFRDHKGPGTYAFGYDVEDHVTNNVQFRQEERHVNGSVTGSYGYLEPGGHVRIMHYIADHRGYRVSEEKRPPVPVNFHPHHEVSTHPPPPSSIIPVFEGEFIPTAEQLTDVATFEEDFYPEQENNIGQGQAFEGEFYPTTEQLTDNSPNIQGEFEDASEQIASNTHATNQNQRPILFPTSSKFLSPPVHDDILTLQPFSNDVSTKFISRKYPVRESVLINDILIVRPPSPWLTYQDPYGLTTGVIKFKIHS